MSLETGRKKFVLVEADIVTLLPIATGKLEKNDLSKLWDLRFPFSDEVPTGFYLFIMNIKDRKKQKNSVKKKPGIVGIKIPNSFR
jgi:hypothetical protein